MGQNTEKWKFTDFQISNKLLLYAWITPSEKKLSYRPGDFDHSQDHWAIKMMGRSQTAIKSSKMSIFFSPYHQEEKKNTGIHYSEEIIMSFKVVKRYFLLIIQMKAEQNM